MVDIAATLVSKSDQLDNVDLMGGPRVFTIESVTLTGSDEQPLSIALKEYARPWKPGVTMRRLLAHIWDSTDSDVYIGRRVRLFRDDTVSFGKTKPGGTRLSHASHLDKATTVTLPTSKGKFGEFTVQPLVEAAPAPAESTSDRASKAVAWFASKGVPVSSLEAHVGRPFAEWVDADLDGLTADRDAIVEASA